jgi:protein-S-isoprenylcysteine O-methyltransferase Ste14
MSKATPLSAQETPLLRAAQNLYDLDRPLTTKEKVKYTVFSLLFPWFVFMPLLYIGAWIRTWPDRPPAFFGLWWTPLTMLIGFLSRCALLMDHPAIVRERNQRNEFTGGVKEQEPWQEHLAQRAMLVLSLLPIFISSYEAAGRVVSNQADLPMAFYMTGSVLVISSILLTTWVLRTNRYASQVVYKQLGQHLVTTGPYAYVRHPFYTFLIPSCIGWPWTMGSPVWGLIPSLLLIPVLMWRTYHEEEFLVQEFGQSYQRYRRDVPYRMIPGMF